MDKKEKRLRHSLINKYGEKELKNEISIYDKFKSNKFVSTAYVLNESKENLQKIQHVLYDKIKKHADFFGFNTYRLKIEGLESISMSYLIHGRVITLRDITFARRISENNYTRYKLNQFIGNLTPLFKKLRTIVDIVGSLYLIDNNVKFDIPKTQKLDETRIYHLSAIGFNNQIFKISVLPDLIDLSVKKRFEFKYQTMSKDLNLSNDSPYLEKTLRYTSFDKFVKFFSEIKQEQHYIAVNGIRHLI